MIPVIATGAATGQAGPQAFAVAMPAKRAVWLYWIEHGCIVDEITLSIDVACETILALAGALGTFDLVNALCAPRSDNA